MYCHTGQSTLITSVISAGAVVFAACCAPLGFYSQPFCSYSMNGKKMIGCGRRSTGNTACRGRCRWCSCNTVINDHCTWLTLTRVNTMIAKVNT